VSYLQLQFNPPPIINAYTPVTISSNGKSFVSGDDQFRNRLCEQIAKIVKSVVIRSEEGLFITFEDGSVISVSLKPSDHNGLEAIEFRGRDNLWMAI